jgi:hypothetical protein
LELIINNLYIWYLAPKKHNNRYKKVYIAVNIVILGLLFTIFTLNFPESTYKEVQELLSRRKKIKELMNYMMLNSMKMHVGC